MKPGFCYVAERMEPGQAVRQIIASFRRAGVMLTNPHTGRTTQLTEDGEQVETTETDLLQAAASRPELSFQFWFASDTDVPCSFRQVDRERVCHAYSLDGLDVSERQRLTQWAVDYFTQAATGRTAFLLVIDPVGVTAEVDWDAVVREEIPFPTTLPAVLGLPAKWTIRIGDYSGYSRRRVADCELLTLQS